MRTSYAPSLVHRPPIAQNYLRQTVQENAIEEFRRAFTRPWDDVPHGRKLSAPALSSLVKHVRHGDNKLAETAANLAFGYKALGIGKTPIVGMFLDAASIMSAQFPLECPPIEDLSELETQLQGEFDRIQVRLWRKDYSRRTLTEALDRLRRIRVVVDQMIAWIERRLYGGLQ